VISYGIVRDIKFVLRWSLITIIFKQLYHDYGSLVFMVLIT